MKVEIPQSLKRRLWEGLNEPVLSATGAKPRAMRYVLTAIVAVAALVLRKLLNPLLGNTNPYHTAWLAVVFSAWYGGIGPSIVAIVITSVGVWQWILPPYGYYAVNSRMEFLGMLGFLAFSAVIVLLGEFTRQIAVKHERAEAELRQAHEKLEDRVRKRTAALEERTAALQQKTTELAEKARMLDMATDAIFVKTANGKISYWNQGAERLYGWTMSEAVGRFPAELLHSKYPAPLEEIESSDDWEGEIGHTKRDGSRVVVASRWTKIRGNSGEAVGWLEINTDITARKRAEGAARRLSARILTLQDQERRRIARELHDSLGQYLTAAKMSLDRMAAAENGNGSLASECSEIVAKCLMETRTISHLLHPPLLDEAGLASAARWYADGFAERSGIQANLSLPLELGRLHRDVEIALFRVLQEGLTNVHRHSGGSAVNIRLTVSTSQVRLEIKDNGQGIPPEALKRLAEAAADTGVGIAGMRERVRELGGSLHIKSDKNGTLLTVTIPISETVQKSVVEDQNSTKRVSAA